jgi:RNA polymerase sigma factor (TIGR02999 family)
MASGHDIGNDELFALAYRELRAIAHRRLAGGDRGNTLSTTALVHEAYLKLAHRTGSGWHDRPHLLACASLAMRHVLVDRARERRTRKRGGAGGDAAPRQITLDEEVLGVEAQAETLLALDEALERLAAAAPRLAQVVDCRFFGGLSEQETAAALGVTVRTVQRDWVKARVLLRQVLEG